MRLDLLLSGRDSPDTVVTVDLRPGGGQRFVQPRAGREQEQGDLADRPVFVGPQHLHQPFQLDLVEVVLDLVVDG